MSDRLTRFFPLFDAAAILLFAPLARVAHRGDRGLTVWTWLDTAWPFLVGVAIAWLAARRVFQGSAQGMGFGGVVWVLAVVTGLGMGVGRGHGPGYLVGAARHRAALVLYHRGQRDQRPAALWVAAGRAVCALS